MACVIKFLGTASGTPHQVDGLYLRAYDPAAPIDCAYDGGDLITTADPQTAKRFSDVSEAYLCWLTVAPYPYHIRPDGKPNRPLTAFTIEVVNV